MSSPIPERCATCPWLKSDQNKIDELGIEQDEIIREATSDDLEDVANEIAELLAARPETVPQEFIDAFGQVPDAKQIAAVMRAVGSHVLNSASRNIKKGQRDMVTMSDWCKGPIEHTTTRDGIVYSIGVCASLFLLEEDTGDYELAYVRRQD